MTGLTGYLFIIGYGFKGRPGLINRFEGLLLVLSYVLYVGLLFASQGQGV